MPRSVAEWIGATPDTPIPPRVKERVLLRYEAKCANCGHWLYGKPPVYDHKIALINGGENRESNLWPLHPHCHKIKTAFDLAEKARVSELRKKHHGIKRRQSRPLLGTIASGWKKHMAGGWSRRPGEAKHNPKGE